MSWDRSEAEYFSNEHCTECLGRGRRVIRWGASFSVCGCVYRRAFRNAMSRYHHAAHQMGLRSRLFRADVEIAGRRVLSKDGWLIWQMFHACGLEWSECLADPRLRHLYRGSFFHEVYALEETLGRVFLERGIAPSARYYDWGRQPILSKPTRTGTTNSKVSRMDFTYSTAGALRMNARPRAMAA